MNATSLRAFVPRCLAGVPFKVSNENKRVGPLAIAVNQCGFYRARCRRHQASAGAGSGRYGERPVRGTAATGARRRQLRERVRRRAESVNPSRDRPVTRARRAAAAP